MRVFSGLQPSGNVHIGNYLGAIKQWVGLQRGNDALYCIVDVHAITIPQDPKELRRATLETAKTYLAAGVDPQKSTIFIQSHVPAHAELGWILSTLTPLGELERMTQFKEKRSKRDAVYAGLLNYPTLMAADILLYQTELVPVGDDQLQHIELTRSLAERFNNRFGKTFIIPQARVNKTTARIMSLAHPGDKMSKSDPNDKTRINLLDPEDVIRAKIKSAVTDSGNEIVYGPTAKPAISNLINIFAGVMGKPVEWITRESKELTYSEFKNNLADAVVQELIPFQQRFNDLKEKDVLSVLQAGAQKAAELASSTLKDVKKKIGFVL
ncbi:MAG: tryptophan--tRNA ligase [Candidatus Sungbacteria bacterium]|uniref:Tryptophan--tRNA ligase n=1 Tax=Candidatus Sungiibacteriota bacterium TaxID=2750080 RepID=A0A9D6LPC6_9BACT|nr:tryptophan--tRNA ligase [Candidatus Sungbacteria bacterium]